jgi:hypothetical protein
MAYLLISDESIIENIHLFYKGNQMAVPNFSKKLKKGVDFCRKAVII